MPISLILSEKNVIIDRDPADPAPGRPKGGAMFEYAAIPERCFPDIGKYDILGSSEKLVDLENLGFEILSVYYARLLPGATYEAYARESVAEMLIKAQGLLPKGYSLVILDAWRPISVQQALWDEFRRIVSEGEPGLGEEELDYKTSFFVSKPSYDIYSPSVHNTGGAVDLTLRDSDGHILNMGTGFDDFRETANTAYYEKPGLNEEIRKNRRLLYHTMLNAGFSNLPTEWWHYDYGTKFWAYFTGNTALYEGILER